MKSDIVESVRSSLTYIYSQMRRSENESTISRGCINWMITNEVPSLFDRDVLDGDVLARICLLGAVGQQIARVCGSTAWTAVLFALHRLMARRFGCLAIQRLHAESECPLIASSFMPTGIAVKKRGGFLVSGEWAWLTGVDHADWLLLNARDQGSGECRFFLVPTGSGVTIRRRATSGLRASGSHSVSLSGTFVEDELSLLEGEFRGSNAPGAMNDPDPLLRMPVQPILAIIGASVAVGLCEGVVQRTIHLVSRNGRSMDGHGSPIDFCKLGEGATAAILARSSWQQAATELSELRASQENEVDQLVFRIKAGQIVKVANDGALAIASLIGSQRILIQEPVNRSLQDLNTLCAHYVYQWSDITKQAGLRAMENRASDAF